MTVRILGGAVAVTSALAALNLPAWAHLPVLGLTLGLVAWAVMPLAQRAHERAYELTSRSIRTHGVFPVTGVICGLVLLTTALAA